MDESEIDNANDESFDDTQLSDVIGVLENDPDFASPVVPERSFPLSMLNGGGQIPAPPKPSNPGANRRRKGYVRIIEQPASKALRFRYECEGRSAGSIPGVSSTPENKTYPEIQVEGYQGPAVVVVSCVMKDYPYAVHPHNLVGREGCKKGVCTLQIPEDTMRVQFSNLGIQCVKKRDIEASLRQREEIRVDPFRQHYHHKNQPTSIDLNAVRLCFQVFLQGDCTNKYNVPLDPVVSDIIYDKKAMSDLSIVKLSDCVSYVDGGRKDIILLCEKVAKEDIEIHFYELENDKKVWEAKADFQPSQVHKQHAIWFRTPRYKKLDVTEPVKVFIQLFRPSDQVRSEPLPFELLPINAGRTQPFWSFKHDLANKKVNYDLFNSILVNDAKLVAKRQLNVADGNTVTETNNNESHVPNYADVKKSKLDDDVVLVSEEVLTVDAAPVEELDVVAELDAIYSDNRAKLLNEAVSQVVNPKPPAGPPQDESFDDARTYTSLQMAFKNPLAIENGKQYEDVIVNPPSPKVGVLAPAVLPPKPPAKPITPPKRDNDSTLPPLPPKRTKKLETYIGGSISSIQLTGKQADILLTRSGSMRSASVSRSQSFNLQRPKSQGELSPPTKSLPSAPNACSTLPNPKKRGFFSKLFGRKGSKSNTPMPSREASVTPSFHSTKSLQVDQNLSKSSGNISTHSSNSVRIRLKDDSPPPLSEKAVTPTAVTSANFPTAPPFDDDLDMQFDLTDAERYAFYTTMAPQATQSEFDEFSAYYAPVEGGRLLTNAEVAARLAGRT
ncbi:embryonic polarity protein dorsal-like isoform X1 [Rhynchophorus ferrugineus]|uniref:embryonic polarity protein dorsal-like isoform X1 n=2 Tax=Rhynchophorus ferrugineus TaxID=354439 RepID=UPI003FCE6947